ncbi:alkaline phosphatase, partial [Escherichia coli]|nr:alkaline phosphatase [Escherichia coli]
MSTRTRRRLLALVPATALAVAAVPEIAGSTTTDNTQAARQAVVGGKARSVILLIGDGMGDSEITIA